MLIKMEENATKPPNKGKRKIPIEPITNKTRKQVTFSKRRGGLFKKGSELCSLCGAQVAIITFSGAGKLFAFGHPSADDVVQRYATSFKDDIDHDHHEHKCNNNNNHTNDNDFDKYTKGFKEIIGQIEAEKKVAGGGSGGSSSSKNGTNDVHMYGNGSHVDNNGGLFWWDENVDELGLNELEHFKVSLEGLRNEVATRLDEINYSSMSILPPQNFEFVNLKEGNGSRSDSNHQSVDGWVLPA